MVMIVSKMKKVGGIIAVFPELKMKL